MYTPCLHLTSSDEYVHAVGQYMKPFASTPKSRGWGEGWRRKGKGICAVIVSPPIEIEGDFSANKYFKKYDLLLPRLIIVQPKPVGRAPCFIDKKRLLSLNWFKKSCLIWCRVYFLKVYATICRRYLIITTIQRRPASLYPSRCRLGWKPFIFDNHCVECLTKYK